MNRCIPYQALMLDYLYDLPEEAQRRALRQHLDECATCPDALRRAEHEKRLLEAAARVPWPQVCFDARTVGSLPGRNTIFPLTERRHDRRWWIGTVVAACLLVALAGLGVWDVYRGLNGTPPETPRADATPTNPPDIQSVARAEPEKPDGPRTMRPSVHVIQPSARGKVSGVPATVQQVDAARGTVRIMLTPGLAAEGWPVPPGTRVELERSEPLLKLLLLASGERPESPSSTLLLSGDPAIVTGLRVGDRVRVLPLTGGK